jgi:hypothetical protein
MINRQIIGQKKSKNISRKKKPKIEKKNKDLKKFRQNYISGPLSYLFVTF